jgi:hypothetical protein
MTLDTSTMGRDMVTMIDYIISMLRRPYQPTWTVKQLELQIRLEMNATKLDEKTASCS